MVDNITSEPYNNLDEYTRFIEKYQDYPKQLAKLIAQEKHNLLPTPEVPNYNSGTMEKDADIGLSDNIAIASAVEFENAFNQYKHQTPQMSDQEAQARVVFDFINKHGIAFTYDHNKNDILFGNTTREQFYCEQIYNHALTNTNFYDRHIGNMQLLCLEPKTANDLPRNLKGISEHTLNKFNQITPQIRQDILLKRGLYHEALHAAMGTTDERKCDVFALLKIMREYPEQAKTIFDIYNIQRSKMGYTVETLHQKEGTSYQHAVKGGAMTYIMPNTYAKLKEYALNPAKIPENDADVLKLTSQLTANHEFSQEKLNNFQKLMMQPHISPQDLANNEIVQACMRQGNFTDINAYIESDNTLSKFMDKQKNSVKKLSFEQIIESISNEEMMQPYQARSRTQLEEDNEKAISAELQRKYLAFYAKAVHEHVGFENFSPENQKNFQSDIENLYANINNNRKQGDFLKEMAERTAAFVEDRHFEVGIGSKSIHGGGGNKEKTVGNNFMRNKNKTDDFQVLGEGWGEQNGERFPIWQIGTLKNGNEDILMVSIPNLTTKNDYESWKDFIETFDKAYMENQDKWEKGRIVLDVRNNRGGEDKPIDHVAKRLYGNLVNTYKRCEIKDTELSNFFLHQHGAYKPQNYEKDGLNAADLVQRKHFSNQNKILFDETKTFYPFNPQKGFKGRIDVLIDRDVGSSAESAYTSFYHHPNVRYIGENTAGMQQYTQGTFPAPWGGSMRIAVTKLTYWDKEGENIEVKGHKPDIYCPNQDAFEVMLSKERDEGRVLGFREKNEPVLGKQIFAEYNPQASADPRKAYYARYLDPAIAEIEQKNINKEKVNAQLGMVRGKMDKLNHATDNASSLAPTPPKTNHSANFSNLSKQNDTRMGR